MNNSYRFLFYIVLWYLPSVIIECINIYTTNQNQYSSNSSITRVFGYMFMTSYVIHGVFLIPIVAYVADFLLRKILK